MSKLNDVLKEVLKRFKPSKNEAKATEAILKEYIEKVKKNIKANRLNADVLVGGSAAKGTMVKREGYDVDIFIRFDKKYKDTMLSDLAEKTLKGIKHTRVHGSRDYFKAQVNQEVCLEFVPVKRVSKPKDAVNITYLSYSHVTYVKRKLRGKLIDQVLVAKAFCHAQKCYGAESYIRGFSGYGLELLICHYKTFIGFLKAMVKAKSDGKLVIDIEKQHKNRNQVLMDINSAKLQSPIILIDPTYKQRDVLAALSTETLSKFQKAAKDFLKNPSVGMFTSKEIDSDKMRLEAEKNGQDFVTLTLSTDRQEGDIAGSKLRKFCKHLEQEISRFFDVKKSGFEYNKGQAAIAFFSVKNKGEILVAGPEIKDKENADRFRQAHQHVSIKNSRLYAKIKVNQNLKEFLKNWILKNKKRMQEMSVSEIKIV